MSLTGASSSNCWTGAYSRSVECVCRGTRRGRVQPIWSSASLPVASRLQDSAHIHVASNDFMAAGGDGLVELTQGTSSRHRRPCSRCHCVVPEEAPRCRFPPPPTGASYDPDSAEVLRHPASAALQPLLSNLFARLAVSFSRSSMPLPPSVTPMPGLLRQQQRQELAEDVRRAKVDLFAARCRPSPAAAPARSAARFRQSDPPRGSSANRRGSP